MGARDSRTRKASEAQTAECLELVSTLHLLASVYSLSARYAQAEPLYKRELAIREKEGPALNAGFQPALITLLESLAELHRAMDRAKEAEAMKRAPPRLHRRGLKSLGRRSLRHAGHARRWLGRPWHFHPRLLDCLPAFCITRFALACLRTQGACRRSLRRVSLRYSIAEASSTCGKG